MLPYAMFDSTPLLPVEDLFGFYKSPFSDFYPRVYPPNPTSKALLSVSLDALERGSQNNLATVWELGAGSGYVIVNLAKNFGEMDFFASDISLASVSAVKRNAKLFGVNIAVDIGDWYSAFQDLRADLVLIHPPAVPYADHRRVGWGLSSEMTTATFAGDQGVEAISVVLANTGRHLTESGKLIIAIPNWANTAYVHDLAKQHFANVTIAQFGRVPFFPARHIDVSQYQMQNFSKLISQGVITPVDEQMGCPQFAITILTCSNAYVV